MKPYLYERPKPGQTIYWHIVGGKTYTYASTSEGAPRNLDEYRERTRRAYGTLRGVHIGVITGDPQ